MKRDPVERFVEKVEIAGDCFVWTGAIGTHGYGVFGDSVVRGRTVLAHRYAYETFVGPITERTLDHLCRNRPCVNPDHLEPVSLRENILRGEGQSARDARRSTCLHGHPLDGTYFHKRSGRTKRYCMTCNRERGRQRYEKRA